MVCNVLGKHIYEHNQVEEPAFHLHIHDVALPDFIRPYGAISLLRQEYLLLPRCYKAMPSQHCVHSAWGNIDEKIRSKDEEIARLKDVVAEITQENLALKKRMGVTGGGHEILYFRDS